MLLGVWGAVWTAYGGRFDADPAAAETLIRNTAGAYAPKHTDRAELAAWFYVANILLNLDETITRG